MKKLKSIIEIARPVNLLITIAVVFVSANICSDKFYFSIEILFAIFSAAFVAAAGNIINDVYDLEIDKINRPTRPIPSGGIRIQEAIALFFVFSGFSILISYLISITALLLVLVTLGLLYFYSLILKSKPLVGNVVVALCTSLAFIYGGIVVGNIYNSIIPAVFAFLINLIREILKDVEDLDGDKENNLLTFPIKYGIEKAKCIIQIIAIIFILFTFYPFFTSIYKIEYFIIVMFLVNLPLIYFLRSIYSEEFLISLPKLSLLLKVIMIFGLISIYMGLY